MILAKNPNDSEIKQIINKSQHNAAKWVKDLETGDTYYWPADNAKHATIANMLHIETYDRGCLGRVPIGGAGQQRPMGNTWHRWVVAAYGASDGQDYRRPGAATLQAARTACG